MYVQLAKRCRIMPYKEIHLLGCPIMHTVIGLTEEGFRFVENLRRGMDVDIEELSDDMKRLFTEMEKRGFFQENIFRRGNRAVYLHITSKCNMHCIGCYSGSNKGENAVQDLPIEKWFQIVDNLVSADFKEVVISGGEPFLYRGIIELLKYAKEKGCEISCISNATASEEDYRRALPFLEELSFSMDGYNEETSMLRCGMVTKTESLIKRLNQQRKKVRIIFTLHKRNYRFYKEMGQYAKSLEVPYNFSLFTAERNADNAGLLLNDADMERLSEMFDEPVDITDSSISRELGCKTCCGAAKNLLSISPEGNIYPCHMFHQKQFCLGNALEDDITDIIEPIPTDGYFSVDRKEECKDCEYAYLCGGGCLYRAYILNGGIEKKDPLCNSYKKSIDRILAPFV